MWHLSDSHEKNPPFVSFYIIFHLEPLYSLYDPKNTESPYGFGDYQEANN